MRVRLELRPHFGLTQLIDSNKLWLRWAGGLPFGTVLSSRPLPKFEETKERIVRGVGVHPGRGAIETVVHRLQHV